MGETFKEIWIMKNRQSGEEHKKFKCHGKTCFVIRRRSHPPVRFIWIFYNSYWTCLPCYQKDIPTYLPFQTEKKVTKDGLVGKFETRGALQEIWGRAHYVYQSRTKYTSPANQHKQLQPKFNRPQLLEQIEGTIFNFFLNRYTNLIFRRQQEKGQFHSNNFTAMMRCYWISY